MPEVDKKDRPKPGSVTFKDGRASIVIDDKGNTEDFGLDFVCKRMRMGIKGHTGYYSIMVRNLINDIKSRGMNSVPEVRSALKLMAADRRQGVRDLCKQWESWLGNIYMFRNIKTGSKKDDPVKKYEDNFSKINWRE